MKTVFYSNYFSPYRDALWQPLSKLVSLEVRLASGREAGRGWEMSGWSNSEYSLKSCDLNSTNWPAENFFLPNKSWSDLTDVSGVFIGGWENPAFWSVRSKAKRAGIRTIGFYESTPETHSFTRGPVAKFRANFFLGLDAVVSSGQSATQALLNMGVTRKNIFQGFNVVDHAYWNKHANNGRTQSIGNDGHAFLYVGRLIEPKCVSDLIKAFKVCFKENDTLRIVGRGPLHSDLETLITSLDLQESVTLVGPKQGLDLAGEYARAQTLVLPSHKEVWGLVVNEALASGLHAVVAEHCGVVRDVQSMGGVFVFKESTNSRISAMADQMDLSRYSWSGWIKVPNILSKNPRDFALVFNDALSGIN